MFFDVIKYASIGVTFLTLDYNSIANNRIIRFIKNKYSTITHGGFTEDSLKKEIESKKIEHIDDTYIYETYDIIDTFDDI